MIEKRREARATTKLDVHSLTAWHGGHGQRFTHDMFRFPGKFHPPLVEHILRTIDPEVVVDPMAGVGTVAVEAKAAGIPSLSVDIDPVSVFFARVKTSPITQEILKGCWESLRGSLGSHIRPSQEIKVRRHRDIQQAVMQRDLACVAGEDFERHTYWFRRYVLVDFARISHAISNGGLPSAAQRVRRFFLACLVSSVRRISNADPSPVSGLEITSHMRKKIRDGYEIDVYGEFQRRVEGAIEGIGAYSRHLQDRATDRTRATILRGDSKDLRKLIRATGLSPDLILFSPPYCNAIEYWRRHRLEYLLGHFLTESEIPELSRKFIGRTTTGGRSAEPMPLGFRPADEVIRILCDQNRVHKACVLAQYFLDMQARLTRFHRCLPRGGYCVMVVGDSRTGDLLVPTVRTLEWLGIKSGFAHLGTSRYKIKNRSMQFPVKPHPKIEEESIVVLRRTK